MDNQLSGAFGYGIAISSAVNFTVSGNTLVGNTSFIGSRGPNCSTTDTTPNPAPFVEDENNVQSSSILGNFQDIQDGNSLTCILPPSGGDYWPFGGNPSPTPSSPNPTSSSTGTSPSGSSQGLSGGAKGGIAVGVVLGVVAIAVATYFIRKAAIRRAQMAGRY